jgi:hypothetical protein
VIGADTVVVLGGATESPLTSPTIPPSTCPIIHTAPTSATIKPLSHGPRWFLVIAAPRIRD